MLNATSGGSLLPREVIQWLDSLDLTYEVRNPKMDLSNGFLIAEILTRKYSHQISILTFYNAHAKDKKINNWQQIQAFLSGKKFKLSKQEYESIINLGSQTAQVFLFRLYEFLTGNSLNLDRRLTSTLNPPEEPMYKQSTASYVAKDREIHRIVDNHQKQFQTKTMINKHKNHIHAQKYNTGLIQWLIDKRKGQIKQEVQKQRQQLKQRTKSIVNNEQKMEIRQIQLKCFNSSNSKKKKGQYGQISDNKGVLQFLTESCSLLFKTQKIANDLKKLGIEIKEQDQRSLNIIKQIFEKCDQKDQKGRKKLSVQSFVRIIEQMKKKTQLTLIIESINNSYIDFRKFFTLFLKPLTINDRQSQNFKRSIQLIEVVAQGLLRLDPQNTQMMFQQVLLSSVLQIAENHHKRAIICNLCLQFFRPESDCYFSLISKVKEFYSGNLKTYIGLLAHFTERMSRLCDNFQYNLWNQFYYYGFLALNSPAPSTRTNGIKVISKLFSDIVLVSNEMVNEKMVVFSNLIEDSWWQVRAQSLIVFKAILLCQYKKLSGQQSESQRQQSSINCDLNIKTILHYTTQIFRIQTSHNILRIGLIQLADLLIYQPTLCERYLQILLHVEPQIRNDILNTTVIKYGPVVYGANTFNYQLTGAPITWHSIGIVQQLYKYFHSHNIERLSQAHLQILYSAMSTNIKISDSIQWLQIYQQFKRQIFCTLLDQELCQLASSIIKQFLRIKPIHSEIIQASKNELSKTLSQAYLEQGQGKVKTNLLQFFQYLKSEESQYIYKILKDFAEREKNKYLKSNLVDFMNSLSRQRRKQL